MSQSVVNSSNSNASLNQSASGSALNEQHPITLVHLLGTTGLTLLLSVVSGLIFIQITLATGYFYKATLALLMVPLVIPALMGNLLNRSVKRLYIATAAMMMMVTTLTYALFSMAVYTESDLMGAMALLMKTPISETVATTIEYLTLNPILIVAYLLIPILSLVIMLKKKDVKTA